MSGFELDSDSIQLYDRWINTVMNCAMRAGALKIGICARFNAKKNCLVTFCFSQRKAVRRSKPWWIINARRWLIIEGSATKNLSNIRENIYYNIEEFRIKLERLSRIGKDLTLMNL